MPDIPTSPGFDEIVVGFEDETLNITDKLIRGSERLDVISITGMAGLGKTTLARKVFCHDLVILRFDLRAWCCVSQEYDKNRVFRDIFSQVAENKSEDDTDGALLEILMKKCRDDQSWVNTALRMTLMENCEGHKSRDDMAGVLFKSLVKLSEEDWSWNKVSNTLRESIMEKCKNIKNQGDIAKPPYESPFVKDNDVRDDAIEMSPKIPMERCEEIDGMTSQSNIVDKKDNKRTCVVPKSSQSLQGLAEMLLLNVQGNSSWNDMLKTFKSLNDIVETLLNSLKEKCKDSKNWNDIIGEKLRQRLLGKRFLIVLDDVWRTEAWDELNRVFPPGKEGSRVILTSREYEVGKYAMSRDAKPHSLRFFTTEESQDLLQFH